MQHVAIDDAASRDVGDGIDLRELSASLGATAVAINRYRVDPDDGLPAGLHAHAHQEEVFVVLAGRATFETLLPVDAGDATDDRGRVAGELAVGAGEAVRFAPGEFQSGRNDGDSDLVVLALGAPPDSDDVRLPLACPDCDHADLRLDTDDGLAFVCPSCGAERVPAPCPDCGSEDLRVTLAGPGAESLVEVVCADCGAAFAHPPVRGDW